MSFLDKNSDVLEWSSEEFFIPYRCRTDGRIHRYFPDFKVKIQTLKGIKTQVIEIKPYKEVYPPKKPPRMTKRYMTEALTYAKNKSKWEYAEEWCKNRGYDFKIITEKELGLKF
jgi:carbohydrate-selective porin OprB